MKETLAVGIEIEKTYAVEDDMTPGHLPGTVLSTPDMVRLIEQTCFASIVSHLEEGETTVGTHICVSHQGPAHVGEEVTIKTRLKEIKKRRLLFDVEVLAPGGLISKGTHERAAINPARMKK